MNNEEILESVLDYEEVNKESIEAVEAFNESCKEQHKEEVLSENNNDNEIV